MNTIPQEKIDAMKTAFSEGQSIREAMRTFGVAKRTAMRYSQIFGGRPVTRASTRNHGICRYLKNSERIKIWQGLYGPIPEDKRLGWKCRTAYCGDFEHMTLAENFNAYQENWRDITNYKKLSEMSVGEYTEFPRPETKELEAKMRVSVNANSPVPFALRATADGKMFRLYKLADRWDMGRRNAEMERLALYFPAPLGGVELTPEERARREAEKAERRAERLRQLMDRRARLGASSLFRSQFVLSESDIIFLQGKRRSTCTVKACPFPVESRGECRYHSHYFEFKWSMEWRQIDRNDIYANEDTPIPLFTSMQGWELPKSAERTVFEHNGNRNKGQKLSDNWWEENVAKYEAEAKLRPAAPSVRVIPEPKIQYAPETKTGNIQHTGAFVLWKGFGKKKIRKSQRKRPAGWHGNHPEQKPIKRFGRETLDEIPTLSPAARVTHEMEHEFIDEDFIEELEREEISETLAEKTELWEVFENGVYAD